MPDPGNCWVTRLAFEPRIAVGVIEQMLPAGVQVFRRMKASLGNYARRSRPRGDRDGPRRRPPRALPAAARHRRDRARRPAAAVRRGHVIGAETIAQTGEPQAQPVEAKPHCVQSFTYTFACERREGENRVIARPEKYGIFYKAVQPYSLRIEVHGGEIYGETSGWLQYSLYEQMPGTKGGLWTYRPPGGGTNLTMFNWPGNDYRDRSLLDCSPHDAAKALQDAKRVSLGFLYWLQTGPRRAGDTAASRCHG